ncbi:hypothetical protein ABH926_004625 [Catenulispora sp. GP43]|uniref:hypothetical protein n=1 Tax=Catenulispora sp. GP43 TaxID=3156263 RepID=UPI0035152779
MEQDRTLWLTGLEYDVQICAMETSGILPYLVEHRRPDGEWPSNAEVIAAVQSAVDRGWVKVHRLEPWTFPDGREGLHCSDPIDDAELPSILADPDTWDDPPGTDWIGEVALSPTPKWELFLAGRRYAPLATWTRR